MEYNTIEENDILRDKSKEYLDERLVCDRSGLTGNFDDVCEAFSEGCLFTADLAQKIVEEMFSSCGEIRKSLARDFRDRLFNYIKTKKISL